MRIPFRLTPLTPLLRICTELECWFFAKYLREATFLLLATRLRVRNIKALVWQSVPLITEPSETASCFLYKEPVTGMPPL